jgi:hypothetical protein
MHETTVNGQVMKLKPWVWKSLVATLAGSAAHSLLMYFKSQFNILPTFEPYKALQIALDRFVGNSASPLLSWLISFLSGATIIGLLFGRIYQLLPGRSGLTKGVIFGLLGWVIMGLIIFPLLGFGVFATQIGSNFAPAFFSLGMLLAYSVVMGLVYAALSPPRQ